MFSKGFIPARFYHVGTRYRIEDVAKQTFVGFVSTLSELQGVSSPTQGNAYQDGRLLYTNANLNDFARSAGFKNKK